MLRRGLAAATRRLPPATRPLPPKKSKENSQIGGSNENNASLGSLSSDFQPKIDKIKTKIYDKIHRFIKVILKLARNVGYDDELRIKLGNGKYLEKSNIIDLLTHAMSIGKVLYGENEFIELLSHANIDPELIINENVKLKLIQYNNKSQIKDNAENMDIEVNRQSNDNTVQPIKRKLDNDEDFEIPRKKRKTISVYDGDTITLPMKSNEIKSTTPSKKLSFNEGIEDEDIDKDNWIIPNQND